MHNNIDEHQVFAPDEKTKIAQILHEILLSMFKATAATFTNNLALGLNRKDSHERA